MMTRAFPASDYVCIARDLFRRLAVDYLAAGMKASSDECREISLGLAALASGTWLDRALSERQVIALGAAHHAFSTMLAASIFNGDDAHPVRDVLARIEAIAGDPFVRETKRAVREILRVHWRAAQNARRLGRAPSCKSDWIVFDNTSRNRASAIDAPDDDEPPAVA